ncbi:RHS repeat-associated core domain-containing protein [Bacillus sp. FJAT-25509]|uniref:RHS repeat domain-containing protein n=1 Tax=Bacillus sp. FJAT-25509 TaxID=1712029 RepID=UPI0006F47933|nr:RHS repeat-associated core domain-containing protein [Bacillus sp. FJAT-25509]
MGKKSTDTVSNRDYSIVGKVTYTNGEIEELVASFPIGTQEWNRAAVKIPGTKPINKIEISTVFKGNYTGTVWFDGLRLMKGAIVTNNKYDGDGNYVIETEDELGNVSKTTYDINGNKKSETDANEEIQTYEYNAANQLMKLSLANHTKLSYLYDFNGNMTSKKIESDLGVIQPFTYKYDENGSLIETVGPLNDKTTKEYDPNGNNTKTILPNGNTITSEYDGTDRVKSIAYNEEIYYGFTYDKNGNELTVDYPKEARKKEKTYDSSNRVTKQEDRGATQEWKYASTSDKLNELIVKDISLIQNLKYQYNENDQNTVVNDGEHSYRFDYDERGNVKTFTTGNGSGSSFKYDDRGLVQQVVVGNKDGNIILDETYSYDKNGNRTSIKFPDGKNISYEYGKLDQLEKETLKDGTILAYSYDGFGNRTSVKETKNGSTQTTDSQYNLANQLIKFGSETIKYDLNGNRTEDDIYIYKWNAKDQLESITKKGESSPIASYKYDEDGRRIQKNVGTTITNYFYDGDSLNVLYETNGQNQVTKSFIYSESGQLLAMKKGTEKYFYHYNAHGDVIALTDKDRQVVASYEYDAWGKPLKTVEDTVVKDNPYRYAGYQYDAETGYYYLIARYYNPTHGVFLSLDPDPGDEDDILTQNGYTYVGNNPTMKVDPDGHYWQYLAGAGIGAATSVGKYYLYNKMRGKKSNWKGVRKAAFKGAVSGLMWTGAGRALGFISKGKAIGRVLQSKKANKWSSDYQQYKRHANRLITNTKKHLKRTPGRRLDGIKKARKNSLKSKLWRYSNAIGRGR